ncbi:hypothetical protein C8Q75DRAFT_808992 [Abortiporus biennis]|nr:hypothetical protein C8Q75DRAFT_808992 [Abortiporus biennis]
MPSKLESLPAELLVKILTELDGKDIIRCTLISHTFHAIIQESERIQYLIQLMWAGMVDVASNPTDSITKRSLLRDYSTLAFSQKPEYKLISKISDVDVEDVRGRSVEEVFAQGIFAQRVSDGPKHNVVHLHQLPSIKRQVPPSDWRVEVQVPATATVDRIALDPSQDLLFTLSTEKRRMFGSAFTLSTGQTHPLAAPDLDGIPLIPDFDTATSISVFGDKVLILAHWNPEDADGDDDDDDDEMAVDEGDVYVGGKDYKIVVINWKTKELEVSLPLNWKVESKRFDSSPDGALSHDYQEATFLDENHIAIATIIYDANTDEDSPRTAAIDVIDIRDLKATPIQSCTLSFELPAAADPKIQEYGGCSIHCGHPGTPQHEDPSLSSSSVSAPFKQPPFRLANEETILAFTWYYSTSAAQIGHYSGFVPISRLIALHAKEDAGAKRRNLPWVEWGPENTRVLEFDMERWTVYGSRAIITRTDDDDDTKVIFEIADFGDAARRRVISRPPPEGVDYVTESTEIVFDGGEEGKVVELTSGEKLVTSLPYCRYLVDLPVKISNYDDGVTANLSEDAIVTKHMDDPNDRDFSVFSF